MRPLLNALTTIRLIAVLISYFILYGCVGTSTLAQPHESTDYVAKWDFGAKEDTKKDFWPDGWTRTASQQYPKFIPIKISRQTTTAEDLREIEQFRRLASQCSLAYQQKKWPWQVIPETVPPSIDLWLERTLLNPYLLVSMDGGAAEVLSPIVPIDEHSVYFLTASVRSNTSDFAATAKLRFLDAQNKTLFEVSSKPVVGSTEWRTVSTDTRYASRDDIKNVQVVLQVQPRAPKAYRGQIGFDSIRVHRTPRMNLFVDKPMKLYRENESIIVRCTATGMQKAQSKLNLTLVDHNGTPLQSSNPDFKRQEITQHFVAKAPVFWDGQCEWKIPSLEPGYYEIRTQLARGRTGVFELEEQFVVLPNDGLGKLDSRFGWSLSSFSRSALPNFDVQKLIEMLKESRTGKVKLPVWFNAQDPASSREFSERIDRVQTAGIHCVGVIATPPASVREKFPRVSADDTSSALEDSVLVQTFLEPVLRQMRVRVTDFQIGWDNETDFISNPRIKASLDIIKRLASRYGQDAQIISSHNTSLPINNASGVDRWQLYSREELTPAELNAVIDRADATEHGEKPPWLSITPLDANKYSLSVRVQDLAARMLVIAKTSMSPGTAAWISDPTSDRIGLLNENGGPREMWLPFRSLAGALAGNRNIGSIPVSSLGTNHLISNGEKASLIVWSTKPSTCQIYLGEAIRARDVWGRVVSIESVQTEHGPEQNFSTGIWPIIIDGVDLNVARWRMGITLVDRRLDPLKGMYQEIKIRFANQTPSPATGRLQLAAPSIIADSASVPFEIAGNATGEITVPIQLQPDAVASNTKLRLEFIMTGERQSQFAVEEEIQIGSDEIEFEPRCYFDSQDRLWISLDAVNNTNTPMSFDCFLLVPGRARERTQFANLQGRASSSFVLEKGSELIGETLRLKCEQIGSRRILNYPIKVKQDEDTDRR